MTDNSQTKDGGCRCGHVRYQITSDPMIVHACHCEDCQTITGTAFALNALIEANRVNLTSGDVEVVTVPTPSGNGQNISRCTKCKVALWGNYNMGGLREYIHFIRVGTLDNPGQLPPDIHIYTNSKVPWFIIPENAQNVPELYEFEEVWPADSLARLVKTADLAGIKIFQ